MNKSESIAELAAALSKAQGQFDAVVKDSKNPFFKSMYADLATCIDATRPHLSKNGLAIIQMLSGMQNGVTVTTMLTHESGQFISSDFTVYHTAKSDKPDKKDLPMNVQDAGGLATYARRYSYCAMLGLAQEDNDGNGNIKEYKREYTDYTDERFQANKETWKEAIKDKKHTVESIHAFVKSKGQKFTALQLDEMGEW